MKIFRSTAISPFIVAGSMLLYGLIFLLLYPYVGVTAAVLNVIPASIFGLVLGVRGGLVFGLFALPVNLFLFWIMSDPTFKSLAGHLVGVTTMSCASAGIGWVGDLNVQVQKQAEELQAERKLLQEEIVRRTHAEEKLAHEALHDPLTELPNRRLFFNRLEYAYAWSKRNPESPCAVLYLDLDNFKTINDGMGHEAGDQLLKQVAGRLKSLVRDIDTVARMGGDEFAILLEAASSAEGVTEIIQRIQAGLALPFDLQGREIASGASIGVVISIATYTELNAILRDADTAMYQAKATGGNQFRVFDVGMRE